MENAVITLTNARLEQIAAGLAALDGLRAKPGEFEPFLFDPETTWLIADNQMIVADKLRACTHAKKALAAQHKVTEGMAIIAENSAQVASFMAALDELNEREVSVTGLQKISREKLNVGHDQKKQQNRIPPSALAKLGLILEA